MCQSSIHKACDMQQQKAKKGGVITNSLRNNYSQHHLYRRSWAISTRLPAEFFRIHILVRGQSLCITNICPNHTTGGGVLFRAKVLFSIGVLAHFDQFRLFCCEFTHFSVYFLQAYMMWRCTKMDKFQVCPKEDHMGQFPQDGENGQNVAFLSF